MIERATGSGHDHIDAALQRAQLLRHRLPAVDRHDPRVRAPAVLVHGLGDLHREFARRHEDQAAHRAITSRPVAEPMQ